MTIIGGGPAGVSASVYAGSEGLRTAVVTSERGGQAAGSSRIENYLGFEHGISGPELMDSACSQADRFGVQFFDDTARALQRVGDTFHVLTSGGERIVSRAIVLAMGVQYRRLEVSGIELPEVTYGMPTSVHHGGEHVVIVGGANSAGQAALHAAQTAEHVTLLSRSALEKSMSAYLVERIQAHSKISVGHGAVTSVASGQGITGNGRPLLITVGGAKVGGAMISSLKADRLGIFIGAIPRTAWLPHEIDCDEHGFVLTDSDLNARAASDRLQFETSVGGIFAAGDVRKGSIKRVAAASGEGAQVITSVHRFLSDE